MSTPFGEYEKFNDEFFKKYKLYADKYPYAFMLVEKELRNIEAGREWLAHRNIEQLSRVKIGKLIYSAYVLHFLSILFKSKVQTYVALSKFPYLEKKIKKFYCVPHVLKKNQISNLLNLMTGRDLKLAAIPLAKPIYSKYFDSILENGFSSLSYDFLEQVNLSAERDLKKFVIFLNRLGMERIITYIDSTPSARFICEASKLAGVKYIVMAHGYVQDPKLISIAPIYADCIYMWTDKQKNDLRDAFKEKEQKIKVEYKGSPIAEPMRTEEVPASSRKKICLFILEPLPKNSEEKKRFLKVLKCYANRVKYYDWKACFRLHPKDNSNMNLLLSNGIFGELSITDEVYDDIAHSACVVVTNSSVALQAAALGKKTFQISELKRFSFEHTEEVSLSTFEEYLKIGDDGSSEVVVKHLHPSVLK